MYPSVLFLVLLMPLVGHHLLPWQSLSIFPGIFYNDLNLHSLALLYRDLILSSFFVHFIYLSSVVCCHIYVKEFTKPTRDGIQTLTVKFPSHLHFKQKGSEQFFLFLPFMLQKQLFYWLYHNKYYS